MFSKHSHVHNMWIYWWALHFNVKVETMWDVCYLLKQSDFSI